MYKLLIAIVFLFSGCAQYAVNGTMCDEIANDPTKTIPQECRNYVEAEADKASKKESEILDSEDIIKFEGDDK
ncbi:hypothetical protein [Sulfurimonas sp.]